MSSGKEKKVKLVHLSTMIIVNLVSYLQDVIRVILSCCHKKFMPTHNSFSQKVLEDHAREAIISVLLLQQNRDKNNQQLLKMACHIVTGRT